MVLQASILNGLLLDILSLFQDLVSSAEVDIRRCEIAEALVVSAIVIMVDKCADLSVQVFRKEVIFEQDPVFQPLVSALVLDAFAAGCSQRNVQRICHVADFHVRAQLPSHNVTREVIENGG